MFDRVQRGTLESVNPFLAVFMRTIPWVVLFFLFACSFQAAPPSSVTPRLVAFSPALANLTFDLGLEDHLVGVSAFCHLPPDHDLPVLGSALSVRIEPILAVQPDIVMIQMEPQLFEPLRTIDPKIRIEHFHLETLDDIARAITRLGNLTGSEARASTIRTGFEAQIASIRRTVRDQPHPKVLFVMGYQNPAAPGAGTFVDELIDAAGGINILSDQAEGWIKASLESIMRLDPDVIVCQAEEADVQAASAYWSHLGPQRTHAQPRCIHVVTDPTWTIPSMRILGHLHWLACRLHPDLEIPASPLP